LSDLPGQVRRTVSAVEGCDICVSLFESGMFATGQGEIAHDMETVATTCCPTWHDANDDLRHESNEALHFENVKAPSTTGVN
jgi:hypothetical protein